MFIGTQNVPHVVRQMQQWQDDLENRLKGKDIPPKYWEHPELEKGNIHAQHCSSCFNLNCESSASTISCSMIKCKFGCGARYHACKTSEHLIICPIGTIEDDYNKMYQGVSGEQRRFSEANLQPVSWWSDKYFSDSFRKATEMKRNKNGEASRKFQKKLFDTTGDLFVGTNETDGLKQCSKKSAYIPRPPLIEHMEKIDINKSLRLSLRFTTEPKHASKPMLMYSFTCSKSFRRDQIQWHWKNVHDDIFGGLDDWMEHRCPLASYGCGFSIRRMHPIANKSQLIHTTQFYSTINYNQVAEGFGMSYSLLDDAIEDRNHVCANIGRNTDFDSLPCEILYQIFSHLDSFR